MLSAFALYAETESVFRFWVIQKRLTHLLPLTFVSLESAFLSQNYIPSTQTAPSPRPQSMRDNDGSFSQVVGRLLAPLGYDRKVYGLIISKRWMHSNLSRYNCQRRAGLRHPVVLLPTPDLEHPNINFEAVWSTKM